jgi:signal transduction histidine kinase
MELERILVVDDDESLAQMISLAMRRYGYRVQVALNGHEALKVLSEPEQADHPDPVAVMITDLMMPGMHGMTLLQTAHQQHPNMELIIITAAGSIETAITALREYEAYDYLLKPFESMSQLKLAVDRAAAHRRLVLESATLQARIREDAERLQVLVANTGDAILSANAQGVLTIINPAASRLLGRQDLVGTQAAISLPQTLTRILDNWQAITSHYPAVLEVVWHDATIQMVHLTSIQRINPGSQSNQGWQGWVMVMRDITHLKKMDEVKTRLLADAANKIRVPLAQALNTLAELNVRAAQDHQIGDLVYSLTKQWERIKELGENLTTLAQIDSDAFIRPVSVDSNRILNELVKQMQPTVLRDSGVQLVLNLSLQLPHAQADPTLLRQLLRSLVNRAVQRSSRGGQVHLAAREHQGQVWINVSDDGPPVSAEDLPHIFEKSFVRMDTSPQASSAELALVKSALDRMGGQVWVAGQGSQGSTITICLPAVMQPIKPTAIDHPSPAD